MILLFSLFLGNYTYAQSGLKPAVKEYDRWAYVDAIGLYEKVYQRGYSNQDLVQKLGNANYFNARYADAHKYYQKLFSEYELSQVPVEYYYRYAHTQIPEGMVRLPILQLIRLLPILVLMC